MPPWYRLDNAGKLYPSLSDRRMTTIFRLSADLTAPIHSGRLQEALDNLMPRFPHFAVHLKKGVFWYSLETSTHTPMIQRDSKYPCMRYPLLRRGLFPFRVRCWKNRIAVEFSHVLSDGMGASIFLKSLIAEYLHLSGINRRDCGSLPVPGESPKPNEDEDAFRRYGDPSFPNPPKLEKAFRLPLPLEQPGYYKVTTGRMPLAALKEKARDYGVSITEILISVMLDAFRAIVLDMPPNLRKKLIAPIRINVPVNLRRFWDTKTQRNFFISVEPEIDPRLGDWSFEEIVDRTRTHMRYEADTRYLARRMARNIRGELNTAARLLPLMLKDIFLPPIYASMAAKQYTSGLSNLGLITMPDHLSEYIERFDFIPPPAVAERVKASVIGWNDTVNMSFGRLIQPSVAERYIFRRLIRMGIPVKVESN